LSVPPSVSVVVCCYTEDRWDDIVAAVESVRAQTRPASQLVIAVDHAPELAARVRAHFAAATVVDNDGPRGLSGARNSGIAAATGEIVAFLDDDAIARPDWLERLCAPYADERVAGVGGRVVPNWDTDRPRWFPTEFDWVVGCTYTGHRDDAGAVRNLIGANMSFRRSVFAEIGGFDDRVGRTASLPAGCEETEFCIRLRQRRPADVVWYAPDAVVAHRVPASRTRFRYFQARCRAEGMSKTRVARMVGAGDGLASERTYVLRVLPAGAARDAGRAVTRFDHGAAARVVVRAVGVGLTAAGFVAAKVRSPRFGHTRDEAPFTPALVTQIDLDGPVPALRRERDDAPSCDRAVVLVRSGGAVLDAVELPIPPAGLSEVEVEQQLRGLVAGDATRTPFDEHAARRRHGEHRNVASPHITVVIATCNRPEALRRCLDSVIASDYPSFDVVVVDNAPGSIATPRVVAGYEHAPVTVRCVDETTPGLACAHNRALSETDAPIIAFTDDDVVVDPQWLANIAAGFEAVPHVGCVTGMIFPLEIETRTQDLVERSFGFNKGMRRRVHRIGGPDRRDVLFPYAAGRFGSGANMAFSTEALRTIGGFDPALGTGTRARGGDDLAAFFDVVAAGFALVYEPNAVIFHAHRRDDAGLARQAFGYGAGLTAYLTKTLVDHPLRVFDIVRRLPAATVYAFAGSSAKNARVADEYPRHLVWRERAGMLAGPPLYLWSRRATAHACRPYRDPSEHHASLAPVAGKSGA
jgi:GT2 family glycosyltransferase